MSPSFVLIPACKTSLVFCVPLTFPQKKIGWYQLLLTFIFGMRASSGFANFAGLFWFHQTLCLPSLQDYFGFTRHNSCLLCILSSYLAEFNSCAFFNTLCLCHCITTPSVSLSIEAIIYTLKQTCTARCY